MNIKFKVGQFLDALNIVNMTIYKKGNLETKDVLLSAEGKSLYFYATDFVNQSLAKINVEVIEEGSFPFDPNKFYLALSKRDPKSEATIISNEKQSILKISKSKFQISTTGKQTLLPRMKAMPIDQVDCLLEFDPDSIIDLFRRSKSCVSQDINNTNRYIMRGLHIKNKDKGYLVESTDGFSAAAITTIQDKEVPELDIIISGEFVSVLLSIASLAKKTETKIKVIKDNFIHFKFGDNIVSTSIMVGKFPEVSKAVELQSTNHKIELDLKTTKDTINRILGFESFSPKNTGKICIQIVDKTLAIRAINVPDCEEFIDIISEEENKLPSNKLNISGQKLLDIINSNKLGNITLGLSSNPLSPLYIEEIIPGELKACYVIMPSRD
jgi:DNA polymerase III sliding clamp (beta) subunit (PCNA family)